MIKTYHKLIKKFKKPIFSFIYPYFDNYGLRKLKKNPDLFQTLTNYLKLSDS